MIEKKYVSHAMNELKIIVILNNIKQIFYFYCLCVVGYLGDYVVAMSLYFHARKLMLSCDKVFAR